MNPELMHQLYGGEISDYSRHTKNNTPIIIDNGIDGGVARDIENIYNTQVKGKPSIDTTGIYNNTGMPPIERDPHFDKLNIELTKTLNAIAQQLNLSPDNSTSSYKQKSITIRQQTDTDIADANNNVLKALEELKNLQAI